MMRKFDSSLRNTIVLLVLLPTALDTAFTGASSKDDPPYQCKAFCEVDGSQNPGFPCDDFQDFYCCGSEHERFCCDNKTQDISDDFDENVFCSNAWWLFNWEMALGMLGTVILLLTISACCCQCLAHKTNQQFARTEGQRRRTTSDVATIEMEERRPRREQIFDPESVNAFQPPEYAKDPPKYQDIDFGGPSTGVENAAFAADEGINPSDSGVFLPPPDDDIPLPSEIGREATPPPPYTLYYAQSNEVPRDRSTAEDTEVDTALTTIDSSSHPSSPQFIRVSSSPTMVDNTEVTQEQDPTSFAAALV